MNSPETYFSVDYRSPPSGLGQIIRTSEPEKITDSEGTEVWNYTLVTYSGCGNAEDKAYVRTQYFESQEAEFEGWAGPVAGDIINFLRSEGVTHVYDSELSYDFPELFDDQGYTTLDNWSRIMNGGLSL